MNGAASTRSAAPGFPVPAVRLLGPSGCGKTTLAERLVTTLEARGYRVGVLKSARHHDAPVDRPGADTTRLAAAGARVIAGAFADGAVVRLPSAAPALLLAMLAPACDLVLVEGFHDAALPALVFDGAGPRGAGELTIAHIRTQPMALACRVPGGGVPHFHRDEIAAIADCVTQALLRCGARRSRAPESALRHRRNDDESERSRDVYLRGIRS